MIELVELITAVWLVSCVFEKDAGRVISAHMVFNERLAVPVAWAWFIAGIIFILK